MNGRRLKPSLRAEAHATTREKVNKAIPPAGLPWDPGLRLGARGDIRLRLPLMLILRRRGKVSWDRSILFRGGNFR
jgi:hypothetical protein